MLYYIYIYRYRYYIRILWYNYFYYHYYYYHDLLFYYCYHCELWHTYNYIITYIHKYRIYYYVIIFKTWCEFFYQDHKYNIVRVSRLMIGSGTEEFRPAIYATADSTTRLSVRPSRRVVERGRSRSPIAPCVGIGGSPPAGASNDDNRKPLGRWWAFFYFNFISPTPLNAATLCFLCLFVIIIIFFFKAKADRRNNIVMVFAKHTAATILI